jgi:serine phosphatase RsbU (regulator of sigma subunit)
LKYLIYILLFLISLNGLAQNFTPEEQHQIDSLNAIINNPNSHDTSLVGAYVGLSEILYVSNLDTLLPLCTKAKKIVEQALPKYSAKHLAVKSLKKSLANALNNIGYVQQTRGDIPNALEYYFKCLKIFEEIQDKKGIATTLNNIGFIYANQGDIDLALKYYKKSLKYREEINDLKGVANSYNNIGLIYDKRKEFLVALDYYKKSLKIREEINDKNGLTQSYNNIGLIYDRLSALSNSNKDSLLKEALHYYQISLTLLKETGNKRGESFSLKNISSIYKKLGNYILALEYAKSSLKLAKQINYPENINRISILLSLIYENQSNYHEALDMYKLHVQMRDSLKNEETQKAAIQQQAKYEYEKQKAIDDAEHDKKIAIEQEAKEKQQIITYATGGGLGLVGIFLIFVFNRLQVTRKQKNIIEIQKQEVETQKEVVELAHSELEEKNQEITDSIQYAKRIQNAILPPLKLVKEYLQESFILYKPKDIVAGDFYWLEHKEDKILFAAADCTGHGVPGAMVSVICNNGLNRSVREYGLTDPGEILNKTREIVIAEFEKSEEEVKDGMDIALCSLEGSILKYAGANNPLWIIRNGEIIETKADKQPIGKFDELLPYTTHTFELQKGDSIYIFSDGYADQFGGEKGKKFKAANFKKLLLSIQNESIEQQKELINESFEEWKGDLEQLDDVCVIGVRI